MARDRVQLSVPARGEFAKLARMTAAALASRAGMTYDEVDDVRMAVEEAFVHAVEGRESVGEITLTFTLSGEALTVEVCMGHPSAETGEEAERRASLATFILDSVCDHYEFTSEESGARTLTLVKRVGGVDAD